MGFERNECLGFTYWARGLAAPSAEQAEAQGRVPLLRSVLQDLAGLVLGGGHGGGGFEHGGPLDALAALPKPQLQVRRRTAFAVLMRHVSVAR